MAFLGDITGDFKEIRENWKGRSLGYKVLVILSIIFTTSSLTGLSEVVFKWRGFIKDGLDFYHEWIVGPVRDFLSWINIEISEDLMNFIVLLSLTYVPVTLDNIFYDKGTSRIIGIVASMVVLPLLVGLFLTGSHKLPVALLSIGFILGLFSKGKARALYLRPLIAVAIVLVLAAINKGLQAPL